MVWDILVASQGANPGHGGILPKVKLRKKIAKR
jgi:glutamate synthase domain-containing protein 2